MSNFTIATYATVEIKSREQGNSELIFTARKYLTISLPGISSSHRKIASKSRIEKLIVKSDCCDIRNSRTSNLESKEIES
ncbi:MAG: hypothetical protein F6K18_24715 [Okeania sp. SIO2C2]|uniref:hypothetical protein n=1 Tax=Okeania sp. SIO2C2 TaxID=2607787 RepID=UPI0013BD6C4C|nr:hypothetical protein [Okeania sp. SIO2C2]NEP89774.1 hypothetical protein [Okeania sp. SIO2C2]